MNLYDMPSPGPITRSQTLAMESYKAIQYTRIIAERQPDSDSGDQLRKFFLACAKLCPRALTPEQIAVKREKEAADQAAALAAQREAEAARLRALADATAPSSTNPAVAGGEPQ